jgi:hypothetical protein
MVSSTGGSFQEAVTAARWEAGLQGCDALALTGQGVARSRWGLIVDESTNVSGVCLLRVPRARRPPALRGPERAPARSCHPPCRQGFDCTGAGSCVLSCNPPCAADRECVGHGASALCIPLTVLAPPLAPPTPPP